MQNGLYDLGQDRKAIFNILYICHEPCTEALDWCSTDIDCLASMQQTSK